MKFFSSMFTPLILRIGSSKAIVMNTRKKLVFEAPARVALSLTSGKILAYGEAAVDLASLGAPDIKVVSLFAHGIPIDSDICRAYLLWMRDSFTTTWTRHVLPYAIIPVLPVEFATPYERVFDSLLRSSHFFPLSSEKAVLGDAWMELGASTNERDIILIRVGATQTQLASVSRGMVVDAATLNCGGDDLDRAFIRYMRVTHQMSVPISSCLLIKESFTKAQFAKTPFSIVIRGKSIHSSEVQSVTLGTADLLPLYSHFFDSLATRIYEIVSLQFHLFTMQVNRPLYVSGGLSMFVQLKQSLEAITGKEVRVVSRPTVASVLGIASKVA